MNGDRGTPVSHVYVERWIADADSRPEAGEAVHAEHDGRSPYSETAPYPFWNLWRSEAHGFTVYIGCWGDSGFGDLGADVSVSGDDAVTR